MIYIKNFIIFNEGISNIFLSKANRILKNIKPKIFNSDRSELKKFDISYRKISDTEYDFINKDRIIAKLKVDGEQYNDPIFKLTIFYYDSEIRNINNLKLNQKFKNQNEQPYAKGSKKFYNSESAIDMLVGFWSTKTNSGKIRNPDFRIKL